jgi:oligoribonuclease NrnB/cAMP/cGMP phosphodiesterase (DHH superfamily)
MTKISRTISESVKGRNVVMVDFVYPYNMILEIMKLSTTFIILDHHETARVMLNKISNEYKIFTMDKSGVGITWEYFYPNKPMPPVWNLVQDRDIWTKKFKESDSLSAYLSSIDEDFEIWEQLYDEEILRTSIEKGREWNEYRQIIIKKYCREKGTNMVVQRIDGKLYLVAYTESPIIGGNTDTGSIVLQLYPVCDFAVVTGHNIWNNTSSFSLRSTDNRADVSNIAKKIGGGGHRNAAGAGTKLAYHLPFEVDYSLSELFRIYQGEFINQTCGKKIIGTVEYDYILFRVPCHTPIYTEDQTIQFISDKYPKAMIIVFESYGDDKYTLKVIQNTNYPLESGTSRPPTVTLIDTHSYNDIYPYIIVIPVIHKYFVCFDIINETPKCYDK